MPENKNQHFVPRCHLRSFAADKDRKTVNVFNLDGHITIPAAPLKHQCSKDYFYGTDPNLESAIQSIEGPYRAVLERLGTRGSITPDVDLALRRFMLFQHVRTEVTTGDGAKMVMELCDIPGSDLPVPPLKLRTQMAIQAAMLEFRDNMALVDDLKLRIMRNLTDRPFITSDNPAIFTNRLFHQRGSMRSFGWKTAGAILLMPLAPDLMAILFDGAVYSVPHREGYVDVNRRSDVEAWNEHQFLNLKSNAYFADWEHRDLVADAAAAASPRRPLLRHSVTYAVLDRTDDWGEHYTVEPPSDIRDGRKRLVHARPNRPAPGGWPSFLRFRPDASAWSNGTGTGPTRFGCLKLGFVEGVGYRKIRV